jgi:hypothetical protein
MWVSQESLMRTVFADLRYAFRVMSRQKPFAAGVVIVLALGIGATTAIFSIVNAVLLRPLPFEEPDRLVRIFTRTPEPASRRFEVSPGKFYGWQRDAQSFEGMAMYPCCGTREFALTGTGSARSVSVTAVSTGFFEIVRARPALGRGFRLEEDTPGGKHVVVLSDRFWRTEFGGAGMRSAARSSSAAKRTRSSASCRPPPRSSHGARWRAMSGCLSHSPTSNAPRAGITIGTASRV